MVKDYLDKFQSLISEASYTDLCIIVVKFYRDHYTTIQNWIIILLVDSPDDIDLVTQFKAVQHIN